MKTQTIALKISLDRLMGHKQMITKITMGMILLLLLLSTQACKKDNLSDPGSSGSQTDTRLIGTWENQEILGGSGFSQIFVDKLIFNTDGSGFEETFTIGDAAESGRTRSDFTWFTKSGNKLNFKFSGQDGFDASYTITGQQDAVAITFPNGNRVIYTKPD